MTAALPFFQSSKYQIGYHLVFCVIERCQADSAYRLHRDASAEAFAAWLERHPTVEIISRDRGTTFADGASRGAPQALQVADRWHLLHNVGEALEKVVVRHHADLKRAFTPEEQLTGPLNQVLLAHAQPVSQTDQVQRARQERPRRYYPPISGERKRQQRTAVSSRQATGLVLRRPEGLSMKDQRTLDLVMQAHPQVKVACTRAQAFALMTRSSDAPAREDWLEEASRSGIAELRIFAAGIKRDQAAVLAALTYEWSQGQVNRLKLLKRQSYGRAGFNLLRHRVLARSA